VLGVDGLHAGYGDLAVLHDLRFEVPVGSIVSLLGANGAGKTTILRAISGLLRPRAGEVRLNGTRIDRLAPERIVDLGISHVPQGRRVFPGLTVYENLRVATTPARARRRTAAERKEDLERVYALFPRLRERSSQLAWSLSGGEQQMLAVGRAVVSRPRVMLLDEPSLGLAPALVEELFDAIVQSQRADGLTILLVEQNAYQALRISEHIHVMERGRITLSGTPAELRDDPAVHAAYIGG
jgi:branched-chain amino acid transport system ATP-binding protein